MSKIYCGIGPVPKGYVQGTMIECAERGKINRFGEHKADSRALKIALERMKIPKRSKLLERLGTLGARIRRLISESADAKNKKKKHEIDKKLEGYKEERTKISEWIETLDNKEIVKKESKAKAKAKETTTKPKAKEETIKPKAKEATTKPKAKKAAENRGK